MRATDPEAWARLCDSARGRGYVFRRGIELALALADGLVEPGRRWLDAGCGTGRLVRALRVAGAAGVGIDADARMIARARRLLPAPPLAVARVEQLPFGRHSVDGIVATSLMGCVADAAPVCAEFWRVLNAPGHALVTFTNRDSWLLRLNYAFGAHRGGGYRLYSVPEAVSLLEAVGFEIVLVLYYGCFLTAGPLTFPPAALARLLEGSRPAWLLTRLARNFIVVAQKRPAPAA